MTGYGSVDAGTGGCLEGFEAGSDRPATPPKIGSDRVNRREYGSQTKIYKGIGLRIHHGLTTTTTTIAIRSNVGTSFIAR